MKKFIILPILANSEETIRLMDLGIDHDGVEVIEVYFFNIDAVGPAVIQEHGVQSLIYSGGQCFECLLPAVTVADLVCAKL